LPRSTPRQSVAVDIRPRSAVSSGLPYSQGGSGALSRGGRPGLRGAGGGLLFWSGIAGGSLQ
jgi:hypothetical protein